MKKSSKNLLIIYISVIILIFIGYKLFTYFHNHFAAQHEIPAVTITATKVSYAHWIPQLSASASLRAVNGINVTTEVAGLVEAIYFTPGANVNKGDILVQLNADNDIALLHSLEANAVLAKITYNRDRAQYAIKAISKQQLDISEANLKSLEAQVKQQADIIAKKTIRAPFTGRLGINQINLGQYLNPGNAIVMLQTTDPIYADFFMPQQSLAELKVGQQVSVTTNTYPNQKFSGKITTINPGIDTTTRNVEVEATLENKKAELTPGMFAYIEVITGKPQEFITLPVTSISFNPYGNIVYIVKNNKVEQIFVTTGETRNGDIKILKGLNVGDIVVTSGQLKLKNGLQVEIDNSMIPDEQSIKNKSEE